jgi:hypothetical protein
VGQRETIGVPGQNCSATSTSPGSKMGYTFEERLRQEIIKPPYLEYDGDVWQRYAQGVPPSLAEKILDADAPSRHDIVPGKLILLG